MATIYSVESVNVTLEKKKPPNLIVAAVGTVTTGGWSNFSLSKIEYVTPPTDGVQEFSFEGTKPTGAVTEALESGKEASTKLLDVDVDNYWGAGLPLTGVRVNASSNSKETALA